MGKRKADYPQKNIAVKKYRAAAKASMAKKSLQAKYRDSQGSSPEVKFYDENINSTSITTAGFCQCINDMVQGDDYNNRVGRKIEMTSVTFQGTIAQTAANFAAAGSGVVTGVANFRCAIVYDKQPTPGTTVSPQDVYNNVTSVLSPYQPRNVNNIERFEVLKVWNETLDTANRLSCPIECYIKMNKETRFNATDGGTVADITTGTLYFLAWSDVTSGANNPSVVGISRVRFKDL